MILYAITGFGLAALIVWWAKRAAVGPATTWQHAPYRVLPDMSDEAMQQHPALCLRRHHVVSCMESQTGLPMVMTVTAHFATEAQAEAELAHYRDRHPYGSVVRIVLAFDPDDPRAVDAFLRMLEGGAR